MVARVAGGASGLCRLVCPAILQGTSTGVLRGDNGNEREASARMETAAKVSEISRAVTKTGASRPRTHCPGRKLRSVVRADVVRHSPSHNQLGEQHDHIGRPYAAGSPARQALPCVFVNDRQQPHSFAFMELDPHEGLGRHVILPLWTQTYTGAVIARVLVTVSLVAAPGRVAASPRSPSHCPGPASRR